MVGETGGRQDVIWMKLDLLGPPNVTARRPKSGNLAQVRPSKR
jgi:hypothetical protein